MQIRQSGASLLIMTLILMSLTMVIIIFAANYGAMQSKSIANINRQQQAMNAAQAGLEFGITYLTVNNATILASPVSGHLAAFSNSSVTNVALSNGSKFSITYSNPIANDYTLILISSTGTSDDNSATVGVSQLVKYGSMLLNIPGAPLVSIGSVALGGNSEIVNTYNNTTVVSGSTVSMSGSSETTLSSGTSSSPGNIQSDIQQNSSSLSAISANDFFASYFGQSPSTIKSSVQNYYTNNVATNYSDQLNGKTGTSIWIDQTSGLATLNGSTTIGSVTNPVLLIINGDIRFNGNLTIYGYVYVNGTATSTIIGNTTIIGGISNTGALSSASGSVEVSYSPTVLANLQNNASMRYYAKVPGSWKDF